MIEFILQLLFGVVWGAGENRVYREKGDALVQQHFKLYHVWMFTIFAIAMYTPSILTWIWLMIWSILILDVVWWLIRYYDFCRDYVKAVKMYGEPNPWHLRTDWDNYLGLPLWHGVYWWWWVFSAILAILGVVIVAIG